MKSIVWSPKAPLKYKLCTNTEDLTQLVAQGSPALTGVVAHNYNHSTGEVEAEKSQV